MRILFTAIGGSDPIKQQVDGPMLHCVRNYKPDIVYMYLSQKMLEYENHDNRYSWVIQKMAEKLGKEIKVVKIERENLTEVHLFDSFYEEFEGILNNIINEYPNAEVYLNASSGTPAMKSSFVIIAAMSHKPIKVIQVSSGEKKPIHNRDNDETYDKELQWEFNLDNGSEYKDRSSIVTNDNFLLKVEKNNIEKYILKYDYASALDIAKKIKDSLSKETFNLINAGYYRFMLNGKETDRYLKQTEFDFIPQKTSGNRKLVEYILWLDVLCKKGDYLSFIRGITPISYELMICAVKEILKVELSSIFEKRGDSEYIITREKLEKSDLGLNILNALDNSSRDGVFKDTFCGTNQLNIIINAFSENEKLKECASKIREVESKVRNEAAHTIVAVDNNFIIEKVNMTSEKIIRTIQEFATILSVAKKDMWSSYDEMNTIILNSLNGSFNN